jgi:hypothetical protein
VVHLPSLRTRLVRDEPAAIRRPLTWDGGIGVAPTPRARYRRGGDYRWTRALVGRHIASEQSDRHHPNREATVVGCSLCKGGRAGAPGVRPQLPGDLWRLARRCPPPGPSIWPTRATRPRELAPLLLRSFRRIVASVPKPARSTADAIRALTAAYGQATVTNTNRVTSTDVLRHGPRSRSPPASRNAASVCWRPDSASNSSA